MVKKRRFAYRAQMTVNNSPSENRIERYTMLLSFAPLLGSAIWIGGGSVGFLLLIVIVVLLLR